MNRLAAIAGLGAPSAYLATVLVGGALTPGYSHLTQPVSALFQGSAPLAAPVSAAFVIYNLLLMAFAIGLFRTLPGPATMILLNGAIGLVIELFPMDAPGAAMSFAGAIHIGLAAALVLTCTLAMGWAALEYRARHPHLFWSTLTLLAIMLVAGGIAAQAAVIGWSWLGLFQRLTIAAYLVWVALLALTFERRAT